MSCKKDYCDIDNGETNAEETTAEPAASTTSTMWDVVINEGGVITGNAYELMEYIKHRLIDTMDGFEQTVCKIVTSRLYRQANNALACIMVINGEKYEYAEDGHPFFTINRDSEYSITEEKLNEIIKEVRGR